MNIKKCRKFNCPSISVIQYISTYSFKTLISTLNFSEASSIRSCLASFESLETELVAAITSFYLHPNDEIRSSVKLLTARWQKEMNVFTESVNLIIDSAAFCQVEEKHLQPNDVS